MAPRSARVAFVTGCNGISGNAIVEHLIRQPRSEWSRIVVTSRSPLHNYWQDPRIEFVALDFLQPVESIITAISPFCRDVTHAFFTSYAHLDDLSKLTEVNGPLFQNFLVAIDTVAGKCLQRVCLQTGGKNYGLHLGPVEAPARETFPRYQDYGENFYFHQEDFMLNLHRNRSWAWNVIRPGGIIGFAPFKNGMSEAITLALYMLINKELGQYPRFPGNKIFYNSCDDKSDAGSLADMSVWAATQEHTKNEAFNHANGDTFVWKYFWKHVAQYWGMEITEQDDFPDLREGKLSNDFHMGTWAQDKQAVWERVCDKYGGAKDAFASGTWHYFDWAVGKTWPTTLSISKAREFGWKRYDDTEEALFRTFKTFSNAGILPHQRAVLGEGIQKVEPDVPAQRNSHQSPVHEQLLNGGGAINRVGVLLKGDGINGMGVPVNGDVLSGVACVHTN